MTIDTTHPIERMRAADATQRLVAETFSKFRVVLAAGS